MIRRLEEDIVKARQEALSSPVRTSYFVFFTSQKDAAIAAQVKLHPEDGHSFQVFEAPGPEEVSSCPSLSRGLFISQDVLFKILLYRLILSCGNVITRGLFSHAPGERKAQ